MVRFFIRTILILFIITAGGVIALLVNTDSREKQLNIGMEDMKASTVLTGRFVEHLVSERIVKLEVISHKRETPDILKYLVEYTDFVATTYGHRGLFMIGLLDSGMNVVNSFNSSKKICSQNNLVNEVIAERLLNGKLYAGPVSEACSNESNDPTSLMMFAVPIIIDGEMEGVVYEVSTLLDYINSYKRVNYFSDFAQARILLDDKQKYRRDSEEYKLLDLKSSVGIDEVVPYNGRMAGFHSFYIRDIKLCMVYVREVIHGGLNFSKYPLAEKYKYFILFAPLLFLVLWIILEMVHVNDKLGDEVRTRTKHLESLQKRYQGLFVTIPEYVLLFSRNGEVLEYNGKFAELMGSDNKEDINVIGMIREKERFTKMLDSIETEFIYKTDEFLLERGDIQVPVSVNACPVELEGGNEILAVMTNISDYKKMQSANFLAQKREVISTLAAGMVHDFSNILQNISLQFNLLERSDDSAKETNMQNIKKILEGANNYLSGVLRYTKDNKDDIFVKRGSIFVKDSIEMLQKVLPSGITIRLEDESSDVKIKAGQVRITQMLINLCQNASEAMEGKGEITIKLSVDEKQFGRFFKLTVSDTGRGIPKDYLDNIFKPFFTTKGGKGTGIGLATVRQIVLEFGGFIEVESEQGEGTSFTIQFAESK